MYRRICGNTERRGRRTVRLESGKNGRVFIKVRFKRPDPGLVSRVIRQEFRNLFRVGVLEVLKQPDQTPGIEPGSGTYVRTSNVSGCFHIPGVSLGMQIAKHVDGDRMRERRPQQERRADFAGNDLATLGFWSSSRGEWYGRPHGTRYRRVPPCS